MTLKTELLKTDAATRTLTVDVEKGTAVFRHTVKPDEDSQSRYQLDWTFDFADVTPEEILTHCAKSLLIKKQAEWRKADNRFDGKVWDDATFKVRDILDAGRKSADPIAKVKNAVAKMSPEERKALIADMQATIDAAEAAETEDE